MINDLAHLSTSLVEPLTPDVLKSVNRLRASEDVRYVAVMPDVHLAKDICVGAVVATERLIYPAAVGGDTGCGMIALAFDADSRIFGDERSAARILAGLYDSVPSNKHRKPKELSAALTQLQLSDGRLQKAALRDGRVQFGTLGRGNHFLEFQAAEDARLWLMIHSGSRAIGQAITEHHLRSARPAESGLKFLDSQTELGAAYLTDIQWARTYAAENRIAMLVAVVDMMEELFGIAPNWDSLLHCDHNHVQQEQHVGKILWVHRKGAQRAIPDEPGIIPGSMGTVSFHTAGRGCVSALMSCSHGAGRALSRTDACRTVSTKDLARQMGKVWYDHRRAAKLRDEAPSAYKDIRQVMRAQRELTRIVRELRPLLSYKGI